ncbi:unnamed protein product [Brassica oleracea var. botrytis]
MRLYMNDMVTVLYLSFFFLSFQLRGREEKVRGGVG